MGWGAVLLIVGLVTATLYGHWLSSDRLTWEDSADCVVPLSGYQRHRLAAIWWQQKRANKVWIPRFRDNPHLRLGQPARPDAAILNDLEEYGLPAFHADVIDLDANEGDVPTILGVIGRQIEANHKNLVVIQCDTLEPRFLRQVADAALSPSVSGRIRFIALPHDQYEALFWWCSRTGWKDTYSITTQLLSNLCWGATTGFDRPVWNPDTWESQTFPELDQAIP